MAPEELSKEPVQRVVTGQEAGQRLDAFLAIHFPIYSRVHLRRVITAGGVLVNQERAKPAYRLCAGQRVTIFLPDLPGARIEPEDIPLDLLYEDEHLVAIHKPAGMVVHPSRGHWSGTLTAALVFHFESLSSTAGPARPGIVHRLDRDTSGVIVVAKSDRAHIHLAAQFEARSVKKEYLAIVAGVPDRDRDWIDQPIGVHPSQREKMAIRSNHSTSRPAASFYEVQARYRGFAVMCVRPRSGRTHQIRVHLAHLGCPVLCDRLYGGRSQITRGEIAGDSDPTVLLGRQALHARRLELEHPILARPLVLQAPLPDDLQTTHEFIRRYRGKTAD